ncbi:MAG: hypothetical protein A3E25_13735 [Burkholderiales bacterium RIFCSPHIGHO2_12_FULL_69_20]|nr:MAG: hypothetical protein A3E25_13735 [Burkholderiales bacterium RIFCSPHIGHO2_12_FULL_69_20]
MALLATAVQAAEPVPVPVLIAHPGVPKVDAATVARLYTGRAIELAGQPVIVANAAPGSALRQRFLAVYLRQDEDKYRAYWTVRRHIGKGVPPPDLPTAAATIAWVLATPGAIGCIDATDLRSGLNVVARP